MERFHRKFQRQNKYYLVERVMLFSLDVHLQSPLSPWKAKVPEGHNSHIKSLKYWTNTEKENLLNEFKSTQTLQAPYFQC